MEVFVCKEKGERRQENVSGNKRGILHRAQNIILCRKGSRFRLPTFRDSINRIRVYLVAAANSDSNKPISSLQPRWRPALTTCSSILSIPPRQTHHHRPYLILHSLPKKPSFWRDTFLFGSSRLSLVLVPWSISAAGCEYCFENDDRGVNSNVTNPTLSTAQIRHSTRMI